MKALHPLAKLTLLSAVVLTSMFSRSLTASCITAFFAVLAELLLNGSKALKTAGIMTAFTLLMAVTNPLFVHEGATPLLFVNKRVYTLEALVYGASAGLTISAVILWLDLLNKILPKGEQLYLFGRLSPRLGLTLSMTLGLIPRMRRKLGQINDAQRTSGIHFPDSTRAQVRSSARVFSALAAWSAESAADTAQAMNARCYGQNKMTCSLKKPMRMRDIGVITASAILAVCSLVLYRMGVPMFYPVITFGSSEGAFAAFFGALSALPAILTLKERLKWRLYTAKN